MGGDDVQITEVKMLLLTKWKIDPSMVKDSPVASFQIFKPVDDMSKWSCLNFKSTFQPLLGQ